MGISWQPDLEPDDTGTDDADMRELETHREAVDEYYGADPRD